MTKKKHPQTRAERRRLAARSRFKDHAHTNETKKYKEHKLKTQEIEEELRDADSNDSSDLIKGLDS